VNNKPLNLNAGKDGYYMYSSYKVDSNSVYNFIGDLKRSDCINCPNSLKIQINDYRVSAPNASSKIDSALQIRNYPFLQLVTLLNYTAKFQSIYNRTAGSYHWNFGDGSAPDNNPNPVHVFSKPGVYNVCLTINGINSCSGSACNEYNIRNNSFRTFIRSIVLPPILFLLGKQPLETKVP